MANSSDENLLFSMWALQIGFIDSAQMLDAAGAWMFAREKPIGQILVEKQFMTESMKETIDGIVRKHIDRTGSIDKSLESLSHASSITFTPGDLASKAQTAKLPAEWGAKIRELSETRLMAPGRSDSSRFKIRKEIGHGGLGVVSEAYDRELDRAVAVKEIRYEHAMNPEFRARFITEAKITGLLDHPGIVPVHSIGEFEDGRPYYAMRLIRGSNMSSAIREMTAENLKGDAFLQRIRPLLRHLIDACNTVEYAFSQHGLLHRDLKPANIMIDKYGETIVVDWGMVKSTETASDEVPQSQMIPAHVFDSGSQPTAEGQFRGTLNYMSPEQAKGMHDLVDHRSDVYGLGATLYTILIGRAPYPGLDWDGVSEYTDIVRANGFIPPRELRKDLPLALHAICMKAMATRREDRYQKASDLAEDIDRWIAGDPVVALPEGVFKRMERWGRKHLTAIASGFIVLSSLSLGLAWMNNVIISERDQARGAEARAVQSRKLASSSIEGVVEKIGDSRLAQIPGAEEIRLELLERVIAEIGVLADKHPQDYEIQGDLVRTEMRLANIYRQKRLNDQAKGRFRSVLKRIESVPTAYRNQDREKQDDWDSYEIDSNYFLCELVGRNEGPRAALELNAKIAPIAEAYMRRNPADYGPATAYARNRIQFAEANFELGDFTLARQGIAQAIQVLESLLALKRDKSNALIPDDPANDPLAGGLFYLTNAFVLDGRCLAAQEKYDAAIKRFEDAIVAADRTRLFNVGAATGTNYLGRAYREMHLVALKQGNVGLASSTYDKAIAILEKRDDNPTTRSQDLLFILTECDRARFYARISIAVARQALQRAENAFAMRKTVEGAAKEWDLILNLATARAVVAKADGDAESLRLAEKEHEEARTKIAEANSTSPLLKELVLEKGDVK